MLCIVSIKHLHNPVDKWPKELGQMEAPEKSVRATKSCKSSGSQSGLTTWAKDAAETNIHQ